MIILLSLLVLLAPGFPCHLFLVVALKIFISLLVLSVQQVIGQESLTTRSFLSLKYSQETLSSQVFQEVLQFFCGHGWKQANKTLTRLESDKELYLVIHCIILWSRVFQERLVGVSWDSKKDQQRKRENKYGNVRTCRRRSTGRDRGHQRIVCDYNCTWMQTKLDRKTNRKETLSFFRYCWLKKSNHDANPLFLTKSSARNMRVNFLCNCSLKLWIAIKEWIFRWSSLSDP